MDIPDVFKALTGKEAIKIFDSQNSTNPFTFDSVWKLENNMTPFVIKTKLKVEHGLKPNFAYGGGGPTKSVSTM